MHPTGAKIRETRRAKNVKVARIASAIKVSRPAYYKREEAGNFSDEELEKIAYVLECSAQDLRPRNGIAPEHEQLVKDLARSLHAALAKEGIDLDPETFSELFNTLHRHFAFRGRVEPKEINSIVTVIRKAMPAKPKAS